MSQRIRSAMFVLAFWQSSMVYAQSESDLRNIKVGDRIPAFSVQSIDGRTISYDKLEGKVLLLLFVMPEQEASLKAMNVVEAALKEADSDKLAVLAVSAQPKATEYFKRLSAEGKFSYPIALDPERQMYGDFGLLVTPTTLMIDESGVLRFELPHLPPGYEIALRADLDLLLGKISQQEHDALLAKSKQAVEEVDRSFTRRLALAQSLVDQRQYEQAIPILLELRNRGPSSLFVEILLGQCYLGVDKVDEAAACLDPLAGRQPAPPVLRFALGCLESRRGHDEQAKEYLEGALKVSPEKGPILYELGQVYERQGKLEKAVECYRAALGEVYR